MPAYQKRVVKERADLDLKIKRLRRFVGDVEFDELSGEEQRLLRQQLAIMLMYSDTLRLRIEAFASKDA